jgi:hypothetical protein
MRLLNTIIFLLGMLLAMLTLSTCSLKRDNPYDVKNPNHLTLTDLSIVTIAASNITATGAQSGAIITPSALCANATLFGICYDTVSNPDITKFVVYGTGRKDSFLCTMSGINAVTSYHCRAFVVIDSVTNYGNDVVFTTSSNSAQGLPSLTTANSDLITANSARSGGSISSSGGSPISARGVCWNTNPGATIALATKTNDGSGSGVFTSNILSLTANTKYYVRAYATNSNGTSYGNDIALTTTNSTGPTIPALSTIAANSIAQTSAQSGGTITNDGGSAITTKGVCWSTSSGPTISLTTKTLDGTGTANFNSSMISLSPGTTYYVRAYATNSVGTGYGNQGTFTTLASLPTLTTSSVASITANTAVSGGVISSDGGGSITTKGVCWSTTSGSGNISSLTKTNDGTGAGIFTSNITGLLPATTYYVKAYATNSAGTSYGNEISFLTNVGLASITTSSIGSVTDSSAMSGGNVTSNGGSTVTAKGICWSTSSGSANISLSTKTVDGTGNGSYSSSITGLSPGTTYYVKAYATNGAGTSYGNEQAFTSNPILPSLNTNSVGSITATTAISGGNITSTGGGSITARGVCWSTTSGAENVSLSTKTIDGTGSGTFTSNITGLTPYTTYYIKAYATNSAGTGYGNEISFNTLCNSVPIVMTSGAPIWYPASTPGYKTYYNVCGKVTSDGGFPVSNTYIYSATTNPPSSGGGLPYGGVGVLFCVPSPGFFSYPSGTTVYFRAAAENQCGKGYGSVITSTVP